LSREALSQNTDDFLKLATTRLDQQTQLSAEQLESRKKLIDASVTSMNQKLEELTKVTHSVDKERRESLGSLKMELSKTAEVTGKLRDTTDELRKALANPVRRGNWGERMAEDVLRLAGFVPGVNYEKQVAMASGRKPDFTFLLPKGLRLNMDVKFPLDNYLKALEATDPQTEKQYRTTFLRDVRGHLKQLTTRDYIDREAGTVDCVVAFIPNEQLYAYIHENDPTLLDEAIRQKIVMCSPLTLYAVLAVVRQAVDHFRLENTSNEVLTLLSSFRKEWTKYCQVVGKLEKALEGAARAFDDLKTTRTRQLEKNLDRIDALRLERDGVSVVDMELDSAHGDSAQEDSAVEARE
jgi:DNA recombination protein RmuC